MVEAATVSMDRGPWSAHYDKYHVWLTSKDFTHDVLLGVYGDFADQEQHIQYAEQLAERLNQLPTGESES